MRAAWAQIDLSALDYNIKNIKAKAGGAEIIGVIKADGYGHGAVKVADVLRENRVDTFAVATLQEAVELRDAGAEEEIVILGLTPDMYAETLAEYRLTPVVMSYENAAAISGAAAAKGTAVSGLIAVDTGMGRIGYMAEDLSTVQDVGKIADLPNFRIRGLFSHFATADAENKTFADEQKSRYERYLSALKKAGIAVPVRTLANSAAIMEIPSVHYDAVRPGIILYGCYPSDEVDRSQLDIKPVMSVKANIVRIAQVPEGFSVSYGRKFIAGRKSLIATIPLGYADGFPRLYSGTGKVIVNGTFAPLAGNICMDQCMADVTDVPGVREGDEVIIMGSDGKNTILADDIGDATGTISYEIICAFGQRLPKVYIR